MSKNSDIIVNICRYLYIDNTSRRWSGRSGGKAGSKQRRFLLPELFSLYIVGLAEFDLFVHIIHKSISVTIFIYVIFICR